MYGRCHLVPRLMAWYGDPDASYAYSGVDHEPLPWTEELLHVRNDMQNLSGHVFNSVMLNLYRNGRDSMGCHADNETELGHNPVIASVSLGETRLIRFRHNKSRKKFELELKDGDVLIMGGEIQHHWRHELPKTAKEKSARINLTFRQIIVRAI